jgi:hypothetical protein
VSDGTSASWLLRSLLFNAEESPEQKLRLREELLAYCQADTKCLANLLMKLRELAGVVSASLDAEREVDERSLAIVNPDLNPVRHLQPPLDCASAKSEDQFV